MDNARKFYGNATYKKSLSFYLHIAPLDLSYKYEENSLCLF